jgi:DNA-binding NtrC family response regulator
MAQPPERDVTPALNGKRVLVVDDDFILLKELESILIGAGAEIAGLCQSVKDALNIIDEDDLAAAVLDVRLEHETVEPVARELSRRGVPFVFYTAHAETEPIRSEWPECKIINKPAQHRTILEAVAGVLIL